MFLLCLANRPSGRTFSFIRRLTLFISYRLSSVTDSSIFIRTAPAIRSFRLPVPASRTLWEGLADGVTSSEMQLKLLNVARASLKELREDFEDYLKSRHREFYVAGEERYDVMLDYCSRHNKLKDYEPFFQTWSDEQMCNYALTLCHMIDRMMMSFLKRLEREFVTEGGIKERMHKARTGYRQQQDARLKQLEAELPVIRKELDEARAAAEKWKAAYEDLKQRALKAYYKQQEEIKRLKDLLGEEA